MKEMRDRQQRRKIGITFDEETNAEDLMTLAVFGAQQIPKSSPPAAAAGDNKQKDSAAGQSFPSSS